MAGERPEKEKGVASFFGRLKPKKSRANIQPLHFESAPVHPSAIVPQEEVEEVKKMAAAQRRQMEAGRMEPTPGECLDGAVSRRRLERWIEHGRELEVSFICTFTQFTCHEQSFQSDPHHLLYSSPQ